MGLNGTQKVGKSLPVFLLAAAGTQIVFQPHVAIGHDQRVADSHERGRSEGKVKEEQCGKSDEAACVQEYATNLGKGVKERGSRAQLSLTDGVFLSIVFPALLADSSAASQTHTARPALGPAVCMIPTIGSYSIRRM
jgi:hypothetical protein